MRLFFVFSLILLTAPRADGVVFVHVQDALVPPDHSPVSMDVYLNPGPDDPVNEQLNRFRIKLDLGNGSPTGVRFGGVGPSSPQNPSLFAGVPFEDLGSDFDTIFVSAALPQGEGRDVSDVMNGLLSVTLQFPPDLVPGPYPIFIDPLNTAFFDSTGAQLPFVPSPDPGGVAYIPEPGTGMAALAAVAFLALRRRRRS